MPEDLVVSVIDHELESIRLLEIAPIAANLSSVMDVRIRLEVLVSSPDSKKEVRFDRSLVRIAHEHRDLYWFVGVDLTYLARSNIDPEVFGHVDLQTDYRQRESLLASTEEIDVVSIPELMIDQRVVFASSPDNRLLKKVVTKRQDQLGHLEAKEASDTKPVLVCREEYARHVKDVIASNILLEHSHDDVRFDGLIALLRIKMRPVPKSGPNPLFDRSSREERALTFDARNLVEPDLGIQEILHGENRDVVNDLLLDGFLTDLSWLTRRRSGPRLVSDRTEP